MGAQAVRLSNVDIDNALKDKDFEVLFQPIFDLGNGALARVESFVRWRHPSLGLLPPGAFISFFESQGRMSELTRYVLAEALERYCAWRGPSAPGFSINLALSDLSDEAFAGRFAVLLRERNFPADLVTLECPMPPVTMDVATAAGYFRRLSETGARLAIEVRGRANDFLRQIDPFPFDEIKTGGAAILRFARTVRGPGLSAISELLDIASKANAAITAVGVEDQASLAALRGLGFSAAQGNHLGKVGPLEAFTPSRVNEVRAALGLEPLSEQDLQALFLTESPALPATARPAKAEPVKRKAAKPAAAPEDETGALVDRLAERLARREALAEGGGEDKDEARPAATIKAAAIARAKQKAAANSGAGPDPAAARSLQEWLTREFSAGAEDAGASLEDALNEIGDGFALAEKGAARAAALEEAETEPPAGPAVDAALESLAFDEEEPLDEAADLVAAQAAEARIETAAEETAPVETETAATVEAPPAMARADSAARSASLTVRGAYAYFAPEMRVAAVRPAPPPPEEDPAAASAPLERRAEVVRKTGAAAEGPAAPEPAGEVAAAGPAKDDSSTDYPMIEAIDLDTEEAGASPASDEAEADAAAPAKSESAQTPAPAALRRRPPARKKNFFTRTVIPYPTHFWPKSWMRAWKRRRRRKERRELERRAAE